MKLSCHRDGVGAYTIYLDGTPVAQAHHTGTHLDDYPWDWYLLGNREGVRGKSTGAADTLRTAKDEVASALGWYSWHTKDKEN